MPKLHPFVAERDGPICGYHIWCPGCREYHGLPTAIYREGGNPTWAFNGDLEKPTFSPSLLVRCGHYADGNHPCWCDYHQRADADAGAPHCYLCHSFIIDGKIQFLSDSTHELAGQTVELPEIER